MSYAFTFGELSAPPVQVITPSEHITIGPDGITALGVVQVPSITDILSSYLIIAAKLSSVSPNGVLRFSPIDITLFAPSPINHSENKQP